MTFINEILENIPNVIVAKDSTNIMPMNIKFTSLFILTPESHNYMWQFT